MDRSSADTGRTKTSNVQLTAQLREIRERRCRFGNCGFWLRLALERTLGVRGGWLKHSKHAFGLVVKSIMDPVAATRYRLASDVSIVSQVFHLLVQVGSTVSGRLLYRSMRWLAGSEEVILRCIHHGRQRATAALGSRDPRMAS